MLLQQVNQTLGMILAFDLDRGRGGAVLRPAHETEQTPPDNQPCECEQCGHEPVQAVLADQRGYAGSHGDAEMCFVEYDLIVRPQQPYEQVTIAFVQHGLIAQKIRIRA